MNIEIHESKDGSNYYEVPGIDEDGNETIFKILISEEGRSDGNKSDLSR